MANYSSKNKEQSQDQIFEKLKVHILKVIELTKKGYAEEEIQSQIFCEEPVSFLIRVAKKNSMWFSAQELKDFKDQRKSREFTKSEIKVDKQYKSGISLKEQRERKKQDNLELLKKLYKLGYKDRKIAEVMGYEIAYVGQMRRNFIKEGKWFSGKELEEIEKERKRLRDIEEEKRKKIIEERNRKQKEVKLKKTKTKKTKSSPKNQVKKYKTRLNSLRTEAKKEDKLEANGEENVSTEGRKKFFDFLVELNESGIEIPQKDLEIMMDSFYIHPEFGTKNNIKLIVSESAKKGGYHSAAKIILELIETLEDEKIINVLNECREWIKERDLYSKILEFKKQNLTNTQIGEKLRLSSAEVSIILNKNMENTEIPEHEEK